MCVSAAGLSVEWSIGLSAKLSGGPEGLLLGVGFEPHPQCPDFESE